MPSSLLVYRCMVISPGDVTDARNAVESVISEWNGHVGAGLQARVEVVRWESHARPDMGGRAQEIINRQLVDSADFGIALFWTRVGTPTGDHASGSVEEVYRLLGRGQRVMTYFSNQPIPPSAARDPQYGQLQKIKERFMLEGLLAEYDDIGRLKTLVTHHVTSLVNELLMKDRTGTGIVPSSGTLTAPAPDVRVQVKQVLASRGLGDETYCLGVTVANHSPVDFYLSSVVFEAEDGSGVFPQRDVLTGEINRSMKIEPGNSRDFYVSPVDLVTSGSRVVCAVAVDKIGRKFRSDPEEYRKASDIVVKWLSEVHR